MLLKSAGDAGCAPLRLIAFIIACQKFSAMNPRKDFEAGNRVWTAGYIRTFCVSGRARHASRAAWRRPRTKKGGFPPSNQAAMDFFFNAAINFSFSGRQVF
jgi:hypothetical protein